MGAAGDVHQLLPLVLPHALRIGADTDQLAARRDLDAEEAAEDIEELRHRVWRDAQVGDHLKRRQVHLVRIAARAKELGLGRLGHRLVLGGEARLLLELRLERGGARVELAAHRRRLQLCAGERGSRLLLLLGVLCSGRGALPLELGLELSHLPQRTRGK